MADVPTSEELVALFDQGMLAREMARRFGLNDNAEILVVGSRCAALHNAGTIDLLHLVESNALQGLKGVNFFKATHFLSKVLPELEATTARMMACVEALVTRGGEDAASNQPNAAFRDWCTKDPLRAREVIAAARGGDDLASRHLSLALEAVTAITEARQISLDHDETRRLSAITALGRMKDADPASRAETLAAFGTLLDSGADDNLRAHMLHTTAALLEQDQDVNSAEAIALVSRLVEDVGDRTLHQAAHLLWAYRNAIQPDIITSLIKALEHLNPINKGTVRELDLGLQALMEQGYDEAAIAYVTKWLSRLDESLELQELHSFTAILVFGPPERLSRVLVQWLLLGAPRLCAGLADAIQGRDMDGPPLNLRAEDLAVSPTAQVFICRKAVGWFFLKPTTAASILVSVLRVCDTGTALEVNCWSEHFS